MLSKLIRYEFKATRRIFLPAFLVLLLLSIANSILIALPDRMLDHVSIPFGVLMTVYVFVMFAVCVLSFAYMISRFYKNLLGDEGYLMFTLPARPSQLIWAKCITSTIWMIVTAIVCTVSLFLLAIPAFLMEQFQTDISFLLFWQTTKYIFSVLVHEYGANLFVVPLELFLLGIAYVVNFCMHIYACLSIGSLANKHRLGFAFLAYLGFGIIVEVIVMTGLSLFGLTNLPAWISMNVSPSGQLHVTLLAFLVFMIVYIIINFVITNYILSKRLNLQ